MALEPWSSYPSAGLLSAIQNGTAAKLEKSQSVSVTLRAVAYHGPQLVSHVAPNGEVEA